MNQQYLKQLRAENRFEEAYKLTKEELKKNPDDIWNKRNHSWSIYYLIKKHVKAGQTAQANHYLQEFNTLQMPSDETLLHERMGYFTRVLDEGYLQVKSLVADGKYAEAYQVEIQKQEPDIEQLTWIAYYLLRSHNKEGKPNVSESLSILDMFFKDYQPSKKLVCKLILQELVKTAPDFWQDKRQSEYLEKAGFFRILEEDDFQKQEWEGKKIISLAERLHIAYSKALLRENADKEKISNYIEEVVEPLLEKYPVMQYVPYFKAKLLLGLGDKDSGLSAFLPFAKKKAGEFWVWQVFAEAHENDPELFFSCLCKAMTCNTKPEFLSNIQEKLIAYLIQQGKYAEAKSELEKLLKLREQKGWGMKNVHRQYLNSDWFVEHNARPLAYEAHITQAESLLGIKPVQTLDIVIHHVNMEKKVFGFFADNQISGFAKFLEAPRLWDIYRVEGSFENGDFFHLKKIERTKDQNHTLLIKIKGKFIQQPNKKYGFVNNVFVEPSLVSKFSLKHNDQVMGAALLAPVKGKKDWAWKMITIDEKNS
jgi:hypothetical protein